jgi:hypothetical protein
MFGLLFHPKQSFRSREQDEELRIPSWEGLGVGFIKIKDKRKKKNKFPL